MRIPSLTLSFWAFNLNLVLQKVGRLIRTGGMSWGIIPSEFSLNSAMGYKVFGDLVSLLFRN